MSRPPMGAGETAAATLQEIFRPILRGYLGMFALYYIMMLPAHLDYYSGVARIQMVSLSGIAAMIGLIGAWKLRKPLSIERTHALLFAMNIIVVSNVVASLSIEFFANKLTYFVIMVMAFGLASVNLRQSFISIGLALAAMLYFLPQASPDERYVYTFLGFAAALASLAIAYYMRQAITRIAHSKIESENQLEEARIIGEELRSKSLSDSLTSLPNRRAFFGALRRAMQDVPHQADTASTQAVETTPKTAQKGSWLLLLDLDGFKAVNDIHGHMTGDALLQEVAARLKHCAGSDAHISRMGGDEFSVIVPGTLSEENIRVRAEAWLDKLAQPYGIDGRHIQISASIGCKLLEAGKSSRSQISEADFALIVAKKQGKNRVVVFNEDHAQQAETRYEVEEALRNADLEKEITLVFQPQYDLRENRIVRSEALARWESPSIGRVEPRRFVRIAEESGLITGITLAVAEKAFSQLRAWPAPVPISLNLSSFDLIADPTINQIMRLAELFEIEPRLVEFEVTETAMMADFDKANANLKRLAEKGFTVALDDFGTGYSNFSYLRALPIKKLKVDRSFLENPGDPMAAKILNSLAGMSRVLGLECLIEGVENEIDLLNAKRAGVDLIQGFYFGEPMRAETLLARIQDGESGDLVSQADVA